MCAVVFDSDGFEVVLDSKGVAQVKDIGLANGRAIDEICGNRRRYGVGLLRLGIKDEIGFADLQGLGVKLLFAKEADLGQLFGRSPSAVEHTAERFPFLDSEGIDAERINPYAISKDGFVRGLRAVGLLLGGSMFAAYTGDCNEEKE